MCVCVCVCARARARARARACVRAAAQCTVCIWRGCNRADSNVITHQNTVSGHMQLRDLKFTAGCKSDCKLFTSWRL